MRLINILKYYPRSSRTEHDHDQILRIESGSEYLASMADSDNENKLNILKELFVSLQFNKSKPNFNILVIYDRNSYLRELILKDTDIQEKLKNLAIEATGGIVIAIRKNIDDGWLKHLHEKLHLVNNGGRERQGNRIKTLLTLEVK